MDEEKGRVEKGKVSQFDNLVNCRDEMVFIAMHCDLALQILQVSGGDLINPTHYFAAS